MKKCPTALLLICIMVLLAACSAGQSTGQPQNGSRTQASTAPKLVQVVAAENFYGDIARQLGGNHVNVTSILSDPNVDPHEYESTVQDGVRVSDADVVIENGLDYDVWIDKLISASPSQNRIVINAGKIAPHLLTDNPHLWYGVDNLPVIAQSIHDAYKKIDPADGADFDNNLATFDNSIASIQQKMADIKAKYSGTPIGLTETIGLYQTQAMGLRVLTPLSFEQAIAEGNDPSARDVQTTNNQIKSKDVKLLIFNKQTITPITTNLQIAAAQLNIPQVYVTETMPLNKTYQSWMMDQLNALQQGLQQVLQ